MRDHLYSDWGPGGLNTTVGFLADADGAPIKKKKSLKEFRDLGVAEQGKAYLNTDALKSWLATYSLDNLNTGAPRVPNSFLALRSNARMTHGSSPKHRTAQEMLPAPRAPPLTPHPILHRGGPA